MATLGAYIGDPTSSRGTSKPPVLSAWHHAVQVIQARRMADSPVKRQMMDVAQRYNGDFTIPLPDMPDEPEFPALSAAIIADTVDSSAQRANDTIPTIIAPAVNAVFESHVERARTRRRAWGAKWAKSHLPLRLARGYRQFFGYGTYCLLVVPDHVQGCAKVETRDALCAYPEPLGPDEVRAPLDIGFVYGRSAAWIIKHYPEAQRHVIGHSTSGDDLWDMLEWIDGEHILVGILGKRAPSNYQRRYTVDGRYVWGHAMEGNIDQAMLLRSGPNRAGVVPGVCPSAVTLDQMVSALKRIIPITDLLNKITALDFIAAERSVFPDQFALADETGTPTIVGGQWKDGRTGEINLLKHVKQLGEMQSQPGPGTQQLMSYLERSARLSAGNPSVFQGEMSGSVRSGQTLSQLGAFAVDPQIKEAHLTMGYALQVVNESIAHVELGYWPNKTYTVFSGWAGDNSHVTYVPAEIWTESKESVVQYPMPGMDAFNSTVALANAVGAKMMSRKTARARHPQVDDPDLEERQITEEVLEDGIHMAALQMVGSGAMAFTDMVAVREKVHAGKTLGEAVAEVQKEAQERQASQPAPPPELAAAPEAMPGINAPGSGGAAGEGVPPEAGMGGGEMNPLAFLEQMAGAMGTGSQGAA